jgi:hypothetical protein
MRRRSFLLTAAGSVLVALFAYRWFFVKASPIMTSNDAEMVIAPEHVACIRRLRFIWVPRVESGGPAVDFEAPFGSPNAYDDLAQAVPGKSQTELRRLFAEVMIRLPVFTEKAKLAPGTYVLPAPLVIRLKQHMDGGDSGIGEDGSFRFTAEHAQLIAAIRWWYLSPNGVSFSFRFDPTLDPQDGKFWRAPFVNFKRPFGDMTYFEIDMAKILGVNLKPNSKDPEEDRLFALYQQMHAALQVFVLNATL